MFALPEVSAHRCRLRRDPRALDLLWNLVPPLAIADPIAHAPAPALRPGLDQRPQLVAPLPDTLSLVLGQLVRTYAVPQPVEVQPGGAPQSPVIREQLRHDVAVDLARVAAPDRDVEQEGHQVTPVLLIELEHLELRQQQLGERDRPRIGVATVDDRDRVTHLERAAEDVALPGIADVVAEQPTPGLQGVELLVGPV